MARSHHSSSVGHDMDDGVRYETRTVKAVRGLESRTCSRWEKEGWEVVSQTPGRLQTEIVIRRVMPKKPWKLIAVGGGLAGVLVLALVILGVTGLLPDESTGDEDTVAVATAPDPSYASTQTPALTTAPTSASGPNDVALTAETNADLAALLQTGDYCSPAVQDFATEYSGRTLTFDASIGALGAHGDAATRYDILVGAGDFSTTTGKGPAFQFRDVNTTSDLHFAGDVPESIGVGTELVVTAQIDRYESTSCLFLLTPVATVVR